MKKVFLSLLLLVSGAFSSPVILAEPFLGEVRMFAGNFAPRGWSFADGQLLPISGNEALFSLLGTMYGGDGRTTFALPDLRGRVPVGVGTGAGLTPIQQGQKFGSEESTVQPSNTAQVATGRGNSTVNLPSEAVRVHQPSLGVHFIIALEGTFPARD